MQCPDCGAYYAEEDEYCGECGRRLSWEASADTRKTDAWVEESDTVKELAGDLLESPEPDPALVEAKPKRSGLPSTALVIGLALLMFGLCAGGIVVWLFLSDDSPPTSTMTEPGPLAYEDNFDDPDSGWSTFHRENTDVSYEDGGYRMTVNLAQYIVWGNPEPALDLGDMVIEVDVRQIEGPLDNNFGVLLRYLEDDDQRSYYWFQISGDGYFSVDLRQQNEWISLETWEASDAIETGLGVTNHIRIDCSGGQFSFYNNDVHLVDVLDETIERGNVGLAAGTFDESGIVVQFDNLRIYELGE
ncbi:MAG: hypothetical protein PVH95_08010 [Anaerolineae bacterium]|jgi:hypothetical protein